MERELNTKDIRTAGIILLLGMIMVVGILLWASRTIAQEKAKEYKLTEVQQLRLSNTQKDAIILKAQLQDVQRQFQDKVTQLMQEAQKVKLENNWPPDTQFDPDKLVFSAPPAKEEKK